MVAAFPESPIVMGACIAITVAMTIRQDLRLAPVAERLSALVRVPRSLPEDSAPLTEVYSLEPPTEGPSSPPTTDIISENREDNDTGVNDSLGDRRLNLDGASSRRGINIIGGHNRVYTREESRRVKQSRHKVKGKRDGARNNRDSTPLKMGIGDLLIGTVKIIHDAITAPLRIIQQLTQLGINGDDRS